MKKVLITFLLLTSISQVNAGLFDDNTTSLSEYTTKQRNLEYKASLQEPTAEEIEEQNKQDSLRGYDRVDYSNTNLYKNRTRKVYIHYSNDNKYKYAYKPYYSYPYYYDFVDDLEDELDNIENELDYLDDRRDDLQDRIRDIKRYSGPYYTREKQSLEYEIDDINRERNRLQDLRNDIKKDIRDAKRDGSNYSRYNEFRRYTIDDSNTIYRGTYRSESTPYIYVY